MTQGTGAAVGGKFYLISGRQNDVSYSTDCWVYDPAEQFWLSTADIPTGVNKAPAVTLDDKIFVFGGIASGGVTDAIQIYDSGTDTWSVSSLTLPMPWSDHGTAYLDGYVYLADGEASGRTNAAYRVSVGYLIENSDLDADGLLDLWETIYFQSLRYGPNDNPDGDGSPNDEEQAAGTDPSDPNSFFAVTDVELVPSGEGPGAHVTWSTVEGKSYQLYYCDEDYSTAMTWLACGSSIVGDGSPHTFIDNGDVGRPSPLDPSVGYRYYEAEVE